MHKPSATCPAAPGSGAPRLRGWPRSGVLLIQTGIFGLAISMCLLARMPWLSVAGIVALAVSAIADSGRDSRCKANLVVAAAGTVVCIGSALVAGVLTQTLGSYLDYYFAGLAGLIWLGFALTGRPVEARLSRKRGVLLSFWAGVVLALWLAGTYIQNDKFYFYLGLAGVVCVAAFSQRRLNLTGFGFHLLNCCIFLVAGLGVTDFFIQPGYGLGTDPDARRSYYSYKAAKEDPTRYARWWNYFLAEWDESSKDLLIPDPEGYLPYRLRPNSQSTLVQSHISINSLGFRGKELALKKGKAYRILALGESTTFGVTLNEKGRPWPEILEDLIRNRLRPERPVQVINAGVPGYRLEHNLHRLTSELLSLKPDMIISYHGFNGFPMLHEALPVPIAAQTAPRYRNRPLRILANCEYKLKVLRFRDRQVAAFRDFEPAAIDPMETPYADAYRRLCKIALTNKIRLVLATFSMAVNRSSPLEAVEFYQASYAGAPWFIQANVLHSRILRQIDAEYPRVTLVDTAPGLDGVSEHFLDLVHFTPSGKRRLAETLYGGIESVLKADLASSLP